MTFDPDIPQQDDDAGTDSRPQIQTNFSQWNTLYGENHVEFDFDGTAAAPYDDITSISRGKHKQVTNVNLSGDPTIAADDEEIQYYAKTANAIISPFLQSSVVEVDQAAIVNQLTAAFISASNGETVVPGGIHLKWGNLAKTGAAVDAYTFVGAPLSLTDFPNDCFIILLQAITIQSPINPLNSVSCSTTGFSVGLNSALAGFTFRFLAIGN